MRKLLLFVISFGISFSVFAKEQLEISSKLRSIQGEDTLPNNVTSRAYLIHDAIATAGMENSFGEKSKLKITSIEKGGLPEVSVAESAIVRWDRFLPYFLDGISNGTVDTIAEEVSFSVENNSSKQYQIECNVFFVFNKTDEHYKNEYVHGLQLLDCDNETENDDGIEDLDKFLSGTFFAPLTTYLWRTDKPYAD